jgi:very-short-patch-repair endonuclease
MTRPKPLPPELAAGAFAVARARELGIDVERLRRSDLTRPFRGTRAHGVASDVLALCAAYRQRMPRSQFFSHETAARILGMPLPPWASGSELHVSVIAPRRAPRVSGVIGHQLGAAQTTVGTFRGFPVTSPAATWCLLSEQLTLDDLVAVGDFIVGGKHPFASIDELGRELADGRRRGIGKLRAAHAMVRVGSESRPESLLRLLLVAAGLPEPRLNIDIRDAMGQFIGRADLAYPAYRVIVEYEGKQHWMSQLQFDHDIDRLDAFAEAAWRVVRVSKQHLFRVPSEAIRRVRSALEAAGWHETVAPTGQ